MKKIFYVELVFVALIFIVFCNKYFIFTTLNLSNTLFVFTLIEILFLGLLISSVVQMKTYQTEISIMDAVHQVALVVFIFIGIPFLDPGFSFHSMREYSKVLYLLLSYYGFWLMLRLVYVYLRANSSFALLKNKYNILSGFLSGLSLVFAGTLILSFYPFICMAKETSSAMILLVPFLSLAMVNYVFFVYWQNVFTSDFKLGLRRGVVTVDLILVILFIVMLPSILFVFSV